MSVRDNSRTGHNVEADKAEVAAAQLPYCSVPAVSAGSDRLAEFGSQVRNLFQQAFDIFHSLKFFIRLTSWSDGPGLEMYAPDDMYALCRKRQAIADGDLEDDEVRRADCDMIYNLHSVLAGFSANGGDFCWLVRRVGRKADLKNWWFRIDRIALGQVPTDELPAHVRVPASRYVF